MDIPKYRDMTLHYVFHSNPRPLESLNPGSSPMIHHSYLNALIGLLFATRVVFPDTVNHAITSAIKPETRHMGIINKGLIRY